MIRDLLDGSRHPEWSLVLRLLLVVGAYGLLRAQLFRMARLGKSEYFKPTLFQGLVRRPQRALVLALLVALAGSSWRGAPWSALDDGAALRVFVFTTCLTLAWFCGCAPHNPYFNRSHFADRALVILAALATWLHPAFACGFVPLALLLAGQFERPIPRQYRWTHKQPLFETLIFFLAHLMVCRITGDRGSAPFLIAAFSSFAAHYFWSGAMKLPLGWLKRDDLSLLFLAAYDNGWCGFLSEEKAVRTARRLKVMNGGVKPMTLAVELGAVVALLDPVAAAVLCLGWCAMHLGIFAASGVFFWMWMILDLAFARLLLDSWGPLGGMEGMRWTALGASAALVVVARWIWAPKRLAWLDTPLSGVYRFTGIGADGRALEISPLQFAPYDFPFAQGRFHYLSSEPNLVDVYGKVKKVKAYEELMKARSASDLEELRRARRGRLRENRARRFDRFVRRFLRNKIESGRRRFLWGLLSPPADIYTFHVTRSRWNGREPLVSVRVHYVETYFDGECRKVLCTRQVREVSLQ